MRTCEIDAPGGGTRAVMMVLEPGDELHASVLEGARRHRIEGGALTAIGAVGELELGYFSLPEKVYMRRVIEDRLEVVALNGNLALKDGEPFLHAHGLFTGRDFTAVGGHVFRAVVSLTLEVFVIRTGAITRAPDPEFGLTRLICPAAPA